MAKKVAKDGESQGSRGSTENGNDYENSMDGPWRIDRPITSYGMPMGITKKQHGIFYKQETEANIKKLKAMDSDKLLNGMTDFCVASYGGNRFVDMNAARGANDDNIAKAVEQNFVFADM